MVPSSGEGAALLLEVVLDRLPDVLELLIDQRRRQLELVALVERVEQLALELRAARAGVLLRDAALHGLAQLGERLQAELLGERVIDRHLARRVDRLRRHLERGIFPASSAFE